MALAGESLSICFRGDGTTGLCRSAPFDWSLTYVVVVSGSGPNVCGHALLNVGVDYFHIGAFYGKPLHLTSSGYRRYLDHYQKTELQRQRVFMRDPEGAQAELERLSRSPWLWLVLPNNCVSFVEKILRAGKAPVLNIWNCPVTAWD